MKTSSLLVLPLLLLTYRGDETPHPGPIDAVAAVPQSAALTVSRAGACPHTPKSTPIGFHGALVCKCGVSQTIPSHTNFVYTTYEKVVYDSDGFFNHAQPTRLTVPAAFHGSMVKLKSQTIWSWGGAGGMQTVIKLNGGFYDGAGIHNQMAVDFTTTDFGAETFEIKVDAGDFFEVESYQTSGIPKDILGSNGTCFSIRVVG